MIDYAALDSAMGQDFYGLDSDYDYDPFWAKVVELGVPVLTHYGSQGGVGRSSTSNYMFNHIGHFADGSKRSRRRCSSAA